MSNAIGWTVTAISSVILLVLIVLKEIFRHQNKHPLLCDIFAWIIVLIPPIYMTIIGMRWTWSESYLAGRSATVAITYSPFHILAILVTAGGAIYYGYRAHHLDRKDDRHYLWGRLNKNDYTIFKLGVSLLLIEIFKQIFFLEIFTGYHWYGFPYQFCSVPLYVFLFGPFVKNKKIQRALYSFTGIFALVAGISVMIVGGDVFTSQISICVHTMMWHGLMVVAGVYTATYLGMGTKIKDYLSALIVLFCFMLGAQVLNIFFHLIDPNKTGPGNVDLFFISPYQGSRHMPILGDIRFWLQERINLPLISGFIYTLVYMFAFSLGGIIVFGIQFLFKLSARKIREHQKSKQSNEIVLNSEEIENNPKV